MFVVRLNREGPKTYCDGQVYALHAVAIPETIILDKYRPTDGNSVALVAKAVIKPVVFRRERELYILAVAAAKTPDALEELIREIEARDDIGEHEAVSDDIKDRLLFPHYIELSFSIRNAKPGSDGETIINREAQRITSYRSMSYPYMPKEL